MDLFSFQYRNREEDYEDPRREFLVRALTMGLFAAGGALAWPRRVAARVPHELPPGQSIYRLRGDVRVNGQRADRDTWIPGDAEIETSSDSSLVFVVAKDAFIMRENSRLRLGAPAPVPTREQADEGWFGSTILTGLRLVTGALLSVFGERGPEEDLNLHTTTATIGIRGTGVYLESARDRSYICTCYGATTIAADSDPASREMIDSSHHDAPRYVLEDGKAGRLIEPAPMIHHTDMELLLIEELVGRTPPFFVSGTGYGAPRRISY